MAGLDDWAWRKGSTYGTIIVDLERHQVIHPLPDRSAGTTADWLERYPDIEMISRDHCGSFAQSAHEGAPQARQIADRFHILQNLREAVQAQLSRAVVPRALLCHPGEEAMLGAAVFIPCVACNRRLKLLITVRRRQQSTHR